MKTILTVIFILFSAVAYGEGNLGDYILISKNTMNGTRYGAINHMGDTVLSPIFDKIDKFDNGYFIVVENGKYGLYDTTSKEIIPCKYKLITAFHEDRAYIGLNEKVALIDKNLKFITDYIFESACHFDHGLSEVSINDKWGVINKSGKQIIPIKFNSTRLAADKIITYTNSWESLSSYDITKFGIVKKVDFGYASKFPIIFNNKGEIIYIGKNEEEVISVDTSAIIFQKYFTDCYMAVGKIIDSKGKEILPFDRCLNFTALSDGYFKVYGNNHNGIVSSKGKFVLPPNFKSIGEFNDKGLAEVYFDDGTYFYVNESYQCVEVDGHACPH